MLKHRLLALSAALVPFSAFASTAEVPTGTFKLGKCEVTLARAVDAQGVESFDVSVLTPTYRKREAWSALDSYAGTEERNYNYSMQKEGIWSEPGKVVFPRFAKNSGYKLEKVKGSLFSSAKTLHLRDYKHLNKVGGYYETVDIQLWLYLDSAGKPKRAYAWHHRKNSYPRSEVKCLRAPGGGFIKCWTSKTTETSRMEDWVDCK